MAKLISKTYGEALFELAVEEEKVDVFMDEITQILTILAENPDFGNLMRHPKIIKEEKVQVVEQVFKGTISDELVGFVELIITKDRYAQIESILQYFLMKVKEFKGIGIANVTTAFPLTENQKKQVEDKLLQTTAYTQMEMHYVEDTAL
ncbi:MAG: ATP synthase F1 subunit delta, partial [Lachnospiraceae bacterium]